MGLKSTVKNWFKTGLKPTQAQFWSLFNSIRWNDETVPVASVDGLQDLLDEKADAELFIALTNQVRGEFLVNRQNEMFFSNTLIIGDTVIGMVEGQFLNAGTYYGGDVNLLASYTEPVIDPFIADGYISVQEKGATIVDFSSTYAGDVMVETSIDFGVTFVQKNLITIVVGANSFPSVLDFVPNWNFDENNIRFRKLENNEYSQNCGISYWI